MADLARDMGGRSSIRLKVQGGSLVYEATQTAAPVFGALETSYNKLFVVVSSFVWFVRRMSPNGRGVWVGCVRTGSGVSATDE